MTTAVVIGGGIAGCSTAYALAQRHIDVTLLERHTEIAQEASGNTLAMLYPKLSVIPSLQSTITLLGFNFTLDLLAKLSNSANFFNACGQIQLAFNAAEKAKQAALWKDDFFHNNQQVVQFLNGDKASEIAGIALKSAGIFLPQAGWVIPRLLCAALCNHSLIKVQTNANVMAIKPSKNGWDVTTINDAFEAENIVICNANDVKQFGFCNSAQITPVRGQIEFFATNAASETLKTIICSDHYLSRSVAGLHCIGTTYSINTAPNDFNTSISAIDTQSNLAALGKISPEILREIDLKSVTSRAAYRSQTLDYRPLAGQLLNAVKLQENPPRYNASPADLPWLHGLYVNAGHGSKGMITAPVCGELIASLICKTRLPIDANLASSMNPSRFLLKKLGLKQLSNLLY
ncbi:MAG: FAD-dependent 5-carboxymethylaminomethyl-2-thiouridine(34) oxidoreductase MnmC [Bdellovibrio sp.]|nr:FAD-dependent 5-carboxymethylaminomethyl-2-thiouridine(34) oxidoreductase MnmC [Methylotenera sp.]